MRYYTEKVNFKIFYNILIYCRFILCEINFAYVEISQQRFVAKIVFKRIRNDVFIKISWMEKKQGKKTKEKK